MTCDCKGCECERLREELSRVLAENAELAAHLEVVTALHDRAREAGIELGKQLINARTVLRKAEKG